jgi:formate dehydrogenase subunit gamma
MRIVRYTLSERVMHWLAGRSYLYLLIGGLAFYAPQLYWLAYLLGGGPAARFWHPWAGLLFTIAMLWMHAAWRADMRLTAADRLWSKAIRSYIENRDEQVPPAGRFNAGQKQFYYVMAVSTLLLLLSGLLMWFPERAPHWILPSAVLLHEVAALVTIGAFIIHVYMGLFLVPGGFKAMVRGYVSPEWAKHHHRLWFDRVAARK